MRRRGIAFLAAAGLLALQPLLAAADEIVDTTDGRKLRLRSDGIYEFLSKLDPALMERAVATAKQWAGDQTLILYCFRNEPNREMLAGGVTKDRDEALVRLGRAGATVQQLRQVSVVIAENFRETPAGADDQALTAACAAGDVEQNVYRMHDIAHPLWLRPPFREWK